MSSKIFVRHKALGYVSNHVPVITRYIKRRRENLLVTCVGRAIHTYGSSHFRLVSMTDLHPEEITCTTGDSFRVYSAAGKTIYAWRRGCELQYTYVGHEYPVKLMLCFGAHLISVDTQSNLKVWDIRSQDVFAELSFSNEHFEVTAIMHPHTYKNKILLGSEQGYLQLWNLLTSSMIYSFKGWGSSVTAIEQSPAIDIVGIGLKNGHIIIHNIKYDEVIMEFQQDWGCVTSLAFRMDEAPILVTGTMYGHLVFWNLDEKKVFSQILNAHSQKVTGLKCLPCEPLLVSSSPDNSLKLWIFDMPDGGARQLRVREGHALPPTYVRFYDSNGHYLLSSGGDSSLRVFNTLSEIYNASFGKATFKLKKVKKKKGATRNPFLMPPIKAFAAECTREKDWDNIAAIHSGIPDVTIWSYDKKTLGEKKLVPERFLRKNDRRGVRWNASATSVFITHCGNFVLIGYSTGHCDKFNIQSGLHRGSYGNEVAHDGAVRGVVSDVLNLTVTTGGSDKLIKWWNFKTKENEMGIITKVELEECISFFTYHQESALLAVALENFSIVLIDNEAHSVVRHFSTHSGRINDMVFSADSKWLVTSGMDCLILTWDLPTGSLVDHFRVDAPCTSLSFSPTGEFLATTHVDYLGVFLWSNRTLYNHVSLKPINTSDEAPLVDLPTTTTALHVEDAPEEDDAENDVTKITHQIQDLVTLSSLDTSKWKNLLNLDIIKQRNKPKEQLKTSGSAPFFLPTVPSMDVRFDFSDLDKDSTAAKVSTKHLESLTGFGKALRSALTEDDYAAAFDMLKKMGPSAIDFEINSLTSGFDTSLQMLRQFLKLIQVTLNSKFDFELAQSYLSLFLKVHGTEIVESEELRRSLEELESSQISSWERIEENLFYNLSVIQALKI